MLGGVRQRAVDAPTRHAADAPDAPMRQRRPAGHEPCARTPMTVAPPTGPLQGCTSRARTDATSTRTPLDVYSRALLLTSTRASPDGARVVLHTSAPSDAHAARRTPPPMRHVSTPSASDTDEKPPPRTVSGVPPSDATVDGETHATDAARWYVYVAPLDAYCCPFIDSISDTPPAACIGDEHSS